MQEQKSQRIKTRKERQNFWKWENDQSSFEDYDDDVNETIDYAYEIYLKNENNKIISMYLDMFRNPGSHEFYLDEMKVVDISKGTKEIDPSKEMCCLVS